MSCEVIFTENRKQQKTTGRHSDVSQGKEVDFGFVLNGPSPQTLRINLSTSIKSSLFLQWVMQMSTYHLL